MYLFTATYLKSNCDNLSSNSNDSSLTIDKRFESDQEGLWSPVTELAEELYPLDSPGNSSDPAPLRTTSSK